MPTSSFAAATRAYHGRRARTVVVVEDDGSDRGRLCDGTVPGVRCTRGIR